MNKQIKNQFNFPNLLRIVAIAAFVVFSIPEVAAQVPGEPPGGGGPGGPGAGDPPPVGGGAPIGGGVGILLALGAAYGARKVYQFKQQKLEE